MCIYTSSCAALWGSKNAGSHICGSKSVRANQRIDSEEQISVSNLRSKSVGTNLRINSEEQISGSNLRSKCEEQIYGNKSMGTTLWEQI